MDAAVREGFGERLVHAAMLIDQGEAVELGRRERHLEVVTAASPVEKIAATPR